MKWRIRTGWRFAVIAVSLGCLVFSQRVLSEPDCSGGLGYYQTMGEPEWVQCPLSGEKGYYWQVSFYCLDCDEEMCDYVWYNYTEDGDYLCHIGMASHQGHEVELTATWKYDAFHNNHYSIIDEYEHGQRYDLYFELF
jgi:hypothetical protein